MMYRKATVTDIPQMQVVRNSVKENRLTNPALVTDEECKNYLTNRGKGWVCEIENKIVGFSIIDLKDNNVWALFVQPEYERRGIGSLLHKLMLDWYFEKTHENVWLSTAPGTRAENFYRMAGWKESGIHGKAEIKFEMDIETWKAKIHSYNFL